MTVKPSTQNLTTFVLFLLVVAFNTFAQESSYHVGFKIIRLCDSSRVYKPNSSSSDKLHYRPIDVDFWYPAEISEGDTTVSFGNLVNLLEQRSNYYDDTKNYDGLANEMLQYFCAGIECTDYDSVREIKTRSYGNAKPIEEKFPLVVYFSALNGMSYENYLLFETLAGQGFRVASISSVGKYPGNMSMDLSDVLEQVDDAKHFLKHIKKSNVHETIGLVGYSWGGLAASMLAMTEPQQVKALVSLDGSEMHRYGIAEDDKKLTELRASKSFTPEKITSPYLYLGSQLTGEEELDSIFNMMNFVQAEKQYLQITDATHESFSTLSALSPDTFSVAKHRLIIDLTYAFLLEKLKDGNHFQNKIPWGRVTDNYTLPEKSKLNDNQKTISGTIVDASNKVFLPYVNVGILNKDIGTTTGTTGKFHLQSSAINSNDTLKISMIGYESQTILLKNWRKKTNHIFYLHERTTALKEVVVMEKKFKNKVLGNKTDSKFFGGKFASDDLGSEMAIRIRIKGSPTYLDKFRWHVSYNTEDTTTFRINIYSVENGLPGENLLRENLIVQLGKQTGTIEFDLSPYDLLVTDDFFISLEWIAGNKNSGIVFSAGFANKGTYYRKASQGKWRKYPMGVGFNVEVKY